MCAHVHMYTCECNALYWEERPFVSLCTSSRYQPTNLLSLMVNRDDGSCYPLERKAGLSHMVSREEHRGKFSGINSMRTRRSPAAFPLVNLSHREKKRPFAAGFPPVSALATFCRTKTWNNVADGTFPI